MTTIRNVTEGKKKSSKVELDFIVPIKLTTKQRGKKRGGRGKNSKESTGQMKI